MELSTVAQKVTILLKQEQGFLTLAAKNQTEADIRAFRIGELIWTEILHGKRGQRGEGQLTKFLPQVGLQKSAAYNYVNLYRGAENIMGEDWASTPEQNFRNNPLPREYWQILGSTFNDDTYFSDFVREELCLRPLLTDGKVDKKLLAEAAELFRRHRKKPGFWNPKRSEMKVKRIYDDEHGYIEGYFDDNDPDDVAAGAKIEKQQMAWEHDLGKLVGEDRSLWSPGSPRWKSDKRLTIPEIAGQAREAEQAVVVDDFTQKLAKVRRKSKVKNETALFRFDCGDFQKLDLTAAPAKPDEKPKAIISDPPYLKQHVLRDPIKPDVPSIIEDFAAWCFRVLAKDGLVAVMFAGLWTDEAIQIFKAAGFERRWTLTSIYEGGSWARIRHRSVLSCSKPVLVFQRQGEQHGKIIEGDVIHCGKRDKSWHVWQQDVESFEQIISKLTDPTDLIVDPFAATGTTGIACLNLKRRFIGSEIDPKTHKTGLYRLQKCVYECETWRLGYQEQREPSTFDDNGNRVWGKKIEVAEEIGEDGNRTVVKE